MSDTYYTQQVLACIMIVIVCVLAAMFSIDQLCTFAPKTSNQWGCLVAIVILFVVVLVYLCYRAMHCRRRNHETFMNTHEWGTPPDVLNGQNPLVAEAAPYSNEHTRQVVGPDPKKEELYTWQYNPQNTLVDYKFYETNPSDPNAAPTQIAPIADGQIGVRNQPMMEVVGQGLCNNNASGTAYGVQSPASAQEVPTGTVDWGYA